MAEIFISYARPEHAIAQRLNAVLSENGHSVWWDFKLYGGERYQEVIEEKLASADAVIVLWSKSSVKSVWVSDEASIGRDRQKLIPLIVGDTVPPLGFRHIQSIKFSDENGVFQDGAEERVLSAISKMETPREASLSTAVDNDKRMQRASRAGSSSFNGRANVLRAIAVLFMLALVGILVFQFPTTGEQDLREITTLSKGDSIGIPKFSYAGESASLEWFAAGISRSVRHHLTVAGFDIREHDYDAGESSGALHDAAAATGVNYVLVGSITELQDHFLFSVTLMNAKSRKIVLSLEKQEPSNTGIQAVNEIVGSIVSLLDTEPSIANVDSNLNPEYYWALGVVSAVDTNQSRSINVDDLKAAAAFLDKARRKNPQDSLAWANLAYAYATIDRQLHVVERRMLAEEALAKAAETGGGTSDLYLAEAVVSFTYDDRTTRLSTSRERLEQALALDGDNIRALKWMSSVLLLEGAYDAALEHVDRALAISPNYNDALGNRASLLLLTGRREAASDAIDAVLEKTPDWGWARRFRSTIRITQGDLAGALDDLIAAEAIDGAAANNLIKSVIYGNIGIVDAANRAIENEALATLAPAAQQYWTGYKKAIIRDDIETAFSNLAKIVSDFGESDYPSNVNLALGFVYYYRGAHEEALEQCRALVSNEPDPSVGPSLAETCVAIAAAAGGDASEAAKLAETYGGLMRENNALYVPYWKLGRLAAIYAAKGDDKRAISAIDRMYKDGWRSPNTAICRTCLHLRIDHPSGMLARLLSSDKFVEIMNATRADLAQQSAAAAAGE